MADDFLRNRFKHALSEGKRLIGGWSLSGSATVVEALAYVPYDYLVIDLEHSPSAPHDLPALLRAAEAAGSVALVRMPNHDPTVIAKVLDLGATSLLLPFVQSAEQARHIVNAAKYPPRGNRGFAAMTRASHYLSLENYVERANDELVLIAQLETLEALDQASRIATVEGIDAVFVGPTDLSIRVGVPGQVTADAVRAPMEACVAEMKRLDVAIGTVCPNPEAASWAIDAGFDYVSVANDLSLMVANARAVLAQLRNATNTPSAGIGSRR